MTYTIRYSVGGERKERSGISAEQARAFCLELSSTGIEATEIFAVPPAAQRGATDRA